MPFGLGGGIVAGLVGGAVSAFGEARGQRRAAKRQDANFDQARRDINDSAPLLHEGFARGAQELRGSIGTIQRGVLEALAALDDGFASEVRRVIDERSVLQANLDQDLASRGLANSTAAVNFQRALRTDTQRSIADTQAQFARDRSNVIFGGAQGVAGVQGNLAQLAVGRGQALANLNTQRANILTSQPIPVQNNLAAFGQLGGLALQGGSLLQQQSNNEALLAAIRRSGSSGSAPITGF